MFDLPELGVLYTEHSDLCATTPLGSLWSYETQVRGPVRHPVVLTRAGNYEYWLERSDPLLNTILPGTGVSVVVNFGDPWAAGRSLATSASLPRVCVVGPVTRGRILRIGTRVHAIGAALPPTQTRGAFGVPASELVDRIVALEDLWTRSEVETLIQFLWSLQTRRQLSELCSALVARIGQAADRTVIEHTASRLITIRGGCVSIDEMARTYGVSRKQFARRFSEAAGVTPKLFARITRFQTLVHALLSSDISQWVSVASEVGFCDQSHMINEFRAFAGSPPTVFFQPHGDSADPGSVQLRGRPSEWLRRAESGAKSAALDEARSERFTDQKPSLKP
jgi:AraC-like DNA-binding protein